MADPLLFNQVFCSLGDNGGFSGARPCKTDAGTCSMGDCPGLSFTQTHRLFLQFLYCRMDAFDGFFFSKNLQDLGCTCRCCLFTGKSSTNRPHDIPGLISMFFTECYQCLKQCIVAVIILCLKRGSTSFNRFREVSSVVFIFLWQYICVSYSGTSS